jgi:transposase InsO family protein
MCNVEAMCRIFGVARSGFYSWLKRPLSNRDREEVVNVKPAIRKAFNNSHETYGCVRISQVLNRMGISISPKRTRRIMHAERLVPKAARRFKRTTISNHGNKRCPDLVNRNFTSETPHRIWTSDFTAIWTEEGWLYLVVFLDICTRLIVGWEADQTMSESVLIKAFNNAIMKRIPLPNAIVHSDQGGQYFGKLFKAILGLYHILQSMGSTGDCYDNAITESLWNTMKTECFMGIVPKTRKEAKSIIFEYIETFYNRERLHSSLGYLSPEEFEKSI